MQEELPNPGQHVPDPGRLPVGLRPRPRHHHPAARDRPLDAGGLRRTVLQPYGEQPEVLRGGTPVAAGPVTPAQVQRDVPSVRTSRQLRRIPAEPHVPQERVRRRHHRQVLVQHRPVPGTRGQLHTKRPQSFLPSICNVSQPPAHTIRRSVLPHVGAPGRTTTRSTAGRGSAVTRSWTTSAYDCEPKPRTTRTGISPSASQPVSCWRRVSFSAATYSRGQVRVRPVSRRRRRPRGSRRRSRPPPGRRTTGTAGRPRAGPGPRMVPPTDLTRYTTGITHPLDRDLIASLERAMSRGNVSAAGGSSRTNAGRRSPCTGPHSEPRTGGDDRSASH